MLSKCIATSFLNVFPKHFGRARGKVSQFTVSGIYFETFGLVDFWTFGLLDFWTLGFGDFGTFGLWDFGTFGLWDFLTLTLGL